MSCDFSIPDMIARNAELYPEKVMMVHEGDRMTFKSYKERCDGCAAGFIGQGIAAGDRIAVLSGSADEYMVLIGAAATMEAVPVLLNIRLSIDELAHILNDCGPKILVSGGEFCDLARKVSSRIPSIRKLYAFKTQGRKGDIAPFSDLCSDKPRKPASPVSSVHGPAMLIYTAAMGGKPKGCLLSQANLIAAGLQIVSLLELSGRDCHICTLPLFHIGGLSMTLATMQQGGKTVMIERFDPVRVLELIERERGTFFGAFPPMLASILDAQENHSFDVSSLRGVGGVESPRTVERFLQMNQHAAFYSLYGQTEAMPVSGCSYIDRPGSIGPPAMLTRVALLDDHERPVPPETQGEICVRSPAVFQGYWNLKEDTAYTFRGGWHHTGDLGRCDADGFLWYAGRKPEKELIKSGGENIYPVEVEKAILGHGAVAEVCVIGTTDPQWGEAVKAICVLKPGCTVSAEALSEYVAARIARYKKPKIVVFVDEIPKTAEGAIDRGQVKKIWGSPA